MTNGRRSSRAGTGYVCNGWKADIGWPDLKAEVGREPFVRFW